MLRWPRGSRRRFFFFRYIWSFIFPDRDVGCTLVKEVNVGAIHLAKNPVTTPNSKHIDIRHHFIRERVANGEFKVVSVPPEEQHADFLTKLLHQGAFEVHQKFVMNIRRFYFSLWLTLPILDFSYGISVLNVKSCGGELSMT